MNKCNIHLKIIKYVKKSNNGVVGVEQGCSEFTWGLNFLWAYGRTQRGAFLS